MTSNRQGIVWMLATMLLFVSLDSMAKRLGGTLPVGEVVWARYAFHALLLAAFLHRRLPAVLVTRRPALQLVRSLLLLVTTFLFFTGLQHVRLVDATVVMFVGPILTTVLAIPLLGEHVGPRRWFGVAAGFAGALIVVRPGTDMMQPGALFPLGAAFSYSLYQVATRRLSAHDGPMTTLCYTALVGVVLSSLVAPLQWVAPAATEWGWMALMGLLGGAGHYCLIRALHAAPAAVVAPYGYSSLVWSTLLGFVLFGELPDGWTAAGAAVIAGSGLYIFHRERVHERAAA